MMATMNSARDRAEELLQSLQRRGRELLEAEEGLARTVRDLIEENNLSPAEVRKNLETWFGRIRGNQLWTQVRESGVVALNDYRGEVEKRVEGTTRRLLDSLQIASKSDVLDVGKQVRALNTKLNDLTKKMKDKA